MNEIGCGLTFLRPFSGFRPIRNNGSEKFKGAPNFLEDQIQNSVNAVCVPCRRLRVCKISGRSVEQAASKMFLSEVCHCSEWPQVKTLERRRRREASKDRSVAPCWPRRTAILQRSVGGVLSLSLQIWSIHLQRGWPGGHFHSRLGSRPSVRSMWCRSALCAGTSSSSRAMAKDGVAATRYGAWDWRKVGDYGDMVAPNKLVPFDLKKLPLALHVECLQGL